MIVAPHCSRSYDIVLAAWQKALKSGECNPALTWGDTGADSIVSLHLLMELERSGHPITFDSIRPDMTVADIAAVLDRSAAERPNALPIVHLFPGLYGDDPRLAHFRLTLRDQINFHVHELPGLRQPAAKLRSLQRTSELAAATIELRQPEGSIFLAGFSFGGGVAFEAARVLSRAGRRVAFLCLLDTIPGEVLKASVPARQWLKTLQLGLMCVDIPRAMLFSLCDRLSPMFAHRLRRYVFGLFRDYAMRRWHPDPIAIATLLAASAEYGPRTEPIWRRLCPHLEIVHLPTGHVQMFEEPAIGVLAPAFETAVRRAVGVALE